MEDHSEPAADGGTGPVAGEPAVTAPGPAPASVATSEMASHSDSTAADESASDPAGEAWTATPEAAAFSRRVAAARERITDFDAVALNPDLPVTTAMAATIALSDSGPEVAYHLGRNPGVAARIAGLDPLSAARELGRIEAQLTVAPKRAVTAAPPPLRSLGAGDTPRRDPDAMSYQEYKAWRRTG